MSSVRLYLSKEAAKTKIPDSWKMWTFVFGAYLLNITIAISLFFTYYYFEVENESLDCGRIDHFSKNFLLADICLLIMYYSQAFLVLYFDRELVKFTKNRHKVNNPNQNQLVPWKSSNQNEESDLQIPVRATYISTISLINIVILAPGLAIILSEMYPDVNMYLVWIMYFCCTIWSTIDLLYSS